MRRYGAFEITRDVGARPRGRGSRARTRRRRRGSLRPGLRPVGAAGAGQRRAPPHPRPRPRRSPAGGRRRSTAGSCGVSPLPRGAWSSGPPPWPSGAGPSTPCRATSESHIHPDHLEEGQVPLISTFRLPVQIHTRSANSKWLDEIAHTNPLWIHPAQRARSGSPPVTWCGSRPRSGTSWCGRGSPRGSGPGSWPAATTWAAGSRPARCREPTPAPVQPVAAAPGSPGSGR